MTDLKTCPACNYTRQLSDTTPDWECPKCQRVYAKIARSGGLSSETVSSTRSPGTVSSRERLINACKKGAPAIDNVTQYLRENYPHIDQWFNQFEAMFNTAVFDDPVALTTKWTTARVNETVGSYRKIKKTSTGRIELLGTPGLKVFSGIFIAAGIFEIFIVTVLSRPPFNKMLGVLAFCGVLIGIGIFMLRKSAIPAVFDLSLGLYWVGKKDPNDPLGPAKLKDAVRLQDVHAVQLIFWGGVPPNTPLDTSQRHSYVCEMNLVMLDGRRVNIAVANHGSDSELRSDAATIARFLGKPLWDAIDPTYGIFDQMRNKTA